MNHFNDNEDDEMCDRHGVRCSAGSGDLKEDNEKENQLEEVQETIPMGESVASSHKKKKKKKKKRKSAHHHRQEHQQPEEDVVVNTQKQEQEELVAADDADEDTAAMIAPNSTSDNAGADAAGAFAISQGGGAVRRGRNADSNVSLLSVLETRRSNDSMPAAAEESTRTDNDAPLVEAQLAPETEDVVALRQRVDHLEAGIIQAQVVQENISEELHYKRLRKQHVILGAVVLAIVAAIVGIAVGVSSGGGSGGSQSIVEPGATPSTKEASGLVMSLVGITTQFDQEDSDLWATATKAFVEDYYNTRRRGLIGLLIRNLQVSSVQDVETTLQVTNTFAVQDGNGGDPFLQIMYNQAITYTLDSGSQDVSMETMATEPFNTSAKRLAYVTDLQSAAENAGSDIFDDLVGASEVLPNTGNPTRSPTNNGFTTEPPTQDPASPPSTLGQTLNPTAAPTRNPTPTNNVSSTELPTQDPASPPSTLGPTLTAAPTRNPAPTSNAPVTELPTQGPALPLSTPGPTTHNPTALPMSNPTPSPTLNSSPLPTLNPSFHPTLNPTALQTRNPTPSPSLNPTSLPTRNPTPSPSLNPTSLPTRNPTPRPTLKPAALPTRNPTLGPTLSETALPTRNPTPPPTLKPTLNPTLRPTPTPPDGMWNPVGRVLHGNGADDYLGDSISLSRNGNVMAIEADQDTSSFGSGYVVVQRYNPSTQQWLQMGQQLVGQAPGDSFGESVSLNGDGTILAVGADENGSGEDVSGRVQVFEFSSGGWFPLGSAVQGQSVGARFGYAVSLSDAGEILAVGAQGEHTANGEWTGSVRLFQYDRGTWNQLGQTLIGQAAEDLFGASVSLSQSGTIVGIGARWNDLGGDRAGQVKVFEYNSASSKWEPLGSPINGQVYGGSFGRSVSLDDSGLIMAVGAEGSERVFVYAYDRSTFTWNQRGQIPPTQQPGDGFGRSVSLNGNGKVLAVGSNFHDVNGLLDSGQVRIFQYDTTTNKWKQVGDPLSGEDADDRFGYSVSLSTDGTIVGVGAPWRDVNGDQSGSAYAFTLNNK